MPSRSLETKSTASTRTKSSRSGTHQRKKSSTSAKKVVEDPFATPRPIPGSLIYSSFDNDSGSGSASGSGSSGGITTTSTTSASTRPRKSASSSSSGHKRARSSFSAALFSTSSPSNSWRKASELESSIAMSSSTSSSTKQRRGGSSSKTGAGSLSTSGGKRSTDSKGAASRVGEAAKERSPAFWQKNYLVAYNLVSAVLWAAVLGRVLLLLPVVGTEHVYGGVGEFAKWVQTGALLEVAHSILGIVRAPLITTVMQVASRILLVWGVVDRHPSDTSPSIFYSSMLIAWSVTEVIRYAFFVMNLKGGGPNAVPRALTWLRYNTFFVLYPLGITSEVVMVWKASRAPDTPSLETTILRVILGVYVPGSYVLYTHMMSQRRKVMRAASGRSRVDSVQGTQYAK